MIRNLLLFGGVLFTSTWMFAQCTISGATTPVCQNSAPQTLSTTGTMLFGPGITGNIFDPSAAGAGTHTIQALQPGSGTTYVVVESGTFAPVAGSGTGVTLSDDQTSAALPIGFTFNFFGNNYTQFYISSNGFIGFDAGMPNGCCSGQLLPSTLTPNNLIAFAWEDLNPSSTGTINYFTTGTTPNQQLIVNFVGVAHYGSTSLPVTAQVILYEGSNIIEMHTTSMPTDAGPHTMGIEDATGANAYTPSGRNSSGTWSATNDYKAFVPMTICATQVITVDPAYSDTVNDYVCQGSTYQFGAQTLTSAGTYTNTFTTQAGCDSNVVLNLSVAPLALDSMAANICTGSTLTWGTLTLTTGGTYSQVFTGPNGCDSTVILTLTEYSPTSSSVSDVICAGSTYQFGSQTLTAPGTYTETFFNSNNCDSVVTLTLTQVQPYTGSINDYICGSDPYIFGTQTITSPGTYTEVFTGANGCDSTITVTLTSTSVPVITLVSTTDEMLGNDGAADISVSGGSGSGYSYSWDNGATTEDLSNVPGGVYILTVTDLGTGCTVTLSVTVESFVGIEDLDAQAFKVYPNPSQGEFFVEVIELKEGLTLEIVSVDGKVIHKTDVKDLVTPINIRQAKAGTYFVHLKESDGTMVQSIVIEK